MDDISQYPTFKHIECAVRNLRRNGFKEVSPITGHNYPCRIFVTDENNRRSNDNFISYVLYVKGRYEVYTYSLTGKGVKVVQEKWSTVSFVKEPNVKNNFALS
jgi:hypothetical protein